jgi:oxygen-independent coproporphyrinogen-3 oxidase
MTPIPLSLYIHFPWCIQKCPYCDFNSHAVNGELPEKRYIDALIRDLEMELPFIWGRRLESVFIGGGTPSLISAAGMQRLMSALRRLLPMRPEMEITLEANPSTFEQARFKQYRDCGINRLSIGIQSFNHDHLRRLGRVHNGQEALVAAEIAKQAGFDNFNLDLMFALPQQTQAQAMQDLQTAIECQPSHISWYQLTIEPNTFFHHSPPANLPDDDCIADIQDQGVEILQQAGFKQYEVSAYSQAGKQCAHNRNYWEFGDYVAIGAGAHGKVSQLQTNSIERYFKYKQPQRYMQACEQGDARSQTSILSTQDLSFEFMLNALRLKQGVERTLFEQRTGLSLDVIARPLQSAMDKGLLSEDPQCLSSSDLGWRFLNEVTTLFLSDD